MVRCGSLIKRFLKSSHPRRLLPRRPASHRRRRTYRLGGLHEWVARKNFFSYGIIALFRKVGHAENRLLMMLVTSFIVVALHSLVDR